MKVHPIGRVSNLFVDIEGMKTHADFDVIEVVEDGGSYPTLLGIGWANDSMAVINFKKQVMTFENQDVRVITPMDPQEGRRYIEPVKDEVGITFITSLKTIFILLSMKNLASTTQVLHPLTLRTLWKTGRIGCMKYHLGNVG